MDQKVQTELLVGSRCSRHSADAACALNRRQHFSAWNDIL